MGCSPYYLARIFLSLCCCLVFVAVPTHAHRTSAFTLSLVHRDFSNPNLKSKLEKWQSAIERSNRRLELIKGIISKAKNATDVVSDDYTTPLWAGSGSYLTDMTIGTPGRSFTAIVDTGSDLVWRNCFPCVDCLGQGSMFYPLQSATYQTAPCDDLCRLLAPGCVYRYLYGSFCVYEFTYADTSGTAGIFSYDTLNLKDISGNFHSIEHFGFGCSHSTRGDFDNAGGLIGLGKGSLSLISQLSIQQFSYCLTSLYDSVSHASPMFLGESPDFTYSANQVQSTALITHPSVQNFYYVKLTGISVGGMNLSIPSSAFEILEDGSGGVIIDSGTTLTYLKTAIYEVVLEAFESAIIDLPRANSASLPFDLCYEISGDVPALTFYFDGSSQLDFRTENYFMNIDGLFCLAIAQAIDDISILGNVQQQNYHIQYDLANERLFFASTNCNEMRS